MATRFYLPSSGTAPVSVTPGSGWGLTTGYAVRPTARTKTGSALADGTARGEAGTDPSSRLDVVFVSETVAAQTISGSFSMVVAATQSAPTANGWLDVRIRVVSNDGATLRGTLWAGSTATDDTASEGAENEEFAVGFETRIKDALALSSVDALSGDRLVFEVGARHGDANTSRTSTRRYGDPVGGSDYALTSGLTATTNVPWISFSQDLLFATPAVFTGSWARGSVDGLDGRVLSNAPVTFLGSQARGAGRARTGVLSGAASTFIGAAARASVGSRTGALIGVRSGTLTGTKARAAARAALGMAWVLPAQVKEPSVLVVNSGGTVTVTANPTRVRVTRNRTEVVVV